MRSAQPGLQIGEDTVDMRQHGLRFAAFALHVPVVVEALTGISLIDLLKNLPAVREATKGGSEKQE